MRGYSISMDVLRGGQREDEDEPFSIPMAALYGESFTMEELRNGDWRK